MTTKITASGGSGSSFRKIEVELPDQQSGLAADIVRTLAEFFDHVQAPEEGR